MVAYYNEFDPKAAAWLRELIKQGHIAPGDVDERSISDVTPDDLRGYTQCHFFAGIGVWSYALRQAGWSDDRPVWTGSCPCQPFSSAGKRKGTSDERHLWPHWFHLISQCRPSDVFGEQVASKDGRAWFDTVQADMEALGFAVGAADLCAAGVGAPHIRQRLWFYGTVADADGVRRTRRVREAQETAIAGTIAQLQRMGDSIGWRTTTTGEWARKRWRGSGSTGREQKQSGKASGSTERMADDTGAATGVRQDTSRGQGEPQLAGYGTQRMADAEHEQHERCLSRPGQNPSTQSSGQTVKLAGLCTDHTAYPTNGFWRDADWLGCRDGKFRPVEPGTSPLVNGAAARVGRLRGYGNAIVAQVAQTFIEATQGW